MGVGVGNDTGLWPYFFVWVEKQKLAFPKFAVLVTFVCQFDWTEEYLENLY